MNETQKPFACAKEGCKMAFTNEDHLNVHKKKHDMALHLGIDNQNNTVVADQTPTPTRFIRNCEEVGLFQDLQNMNPFDETFRKATELVKTGSLHIPNSSSDDTLHTPHIFPHIEEENNISKFSRNNSNEPEFTVTTINDDLLKLSKSSSKNEIEVLSLTDESSSSEKLEGNAFVTQGDLVISSNNTLLSKDRLISNNVSNTIPVSNSDSPPAVVNNLNDIQININEKNVIIKHGYLNDLENSDESEEIIKVKLKEALKGRVKTEGNDLDDCDPMVIQKIESSSLFVSNASPRVIKIPQKRTLAKHSVKDSPKTKATSSSTAKAKKSATQEGTKNKTTHSVKNKSPITQSQLERQREVNRAAQIRSREKKKYWINQMETEIVILKDEKKELWIENQNLKSEILWLKTMLLYHKDCPVARDPQIMQEINQMVKTSQEELQKKMQKNPLKKVVPIRPNAASIIALTPLSSSMLVQVPTSLPQQVSTTPSPVESPKSSLDIAPLPTFKTKTTASSEPSSPSTTICGLSKLAPSLVLSPSIENIGIQNNTHKLENASPSSVPQLVITFPDNPSSTTILPRPLSRQSKIIKVKGRLKIERKKDKKLRNIKVNPTQIINLPNTVLPNDNYFILATPSKIHTPNNAFKQS